MFGASQIKVLISSSGTFFLRRWLRKFYLFFFLISSWKSKKLPGSVIMKKVFLGRWLDKGLIQPGDVQLPGKSSRNSRFCLKIPEWGGFSSSFFHVPALPLIQSQAEWQQLHFSLGASPAAPAFAALWTHTPFPWTAAGKSFPCRNPKNFFGFLSTKGFTELPHCNEGISSNPTYKTGAGALNKENS